MGRALPLGLSACACALALAGACSSPRVTQTTPTASASPRLAPIADAEAEAETAASVTTCSGSDLDATTCSGTPIEGGAVAAADASRGCFVDQVLVEGEYCTEARQDCLVWLEPPEGEVGRCKKFAPSTCIGPRVHKRFCIDIDEYTPPGEKLPRGHISWTDAKRECTKLGKRLCLESEWNFACEGEAMLPYPTGLERPSKVCNLDQMKLLDASHHVRDLRVPSASLTQCISPFGVRSMVGNVDEWTYRDVMNGPNRTALKGGWWMAGRSRCRPATTAHGELYRDFQTGFRCCADGW
jgi:hypothetical protein